WGVWGDAVADGARLAGEAAAVDLDADVEAVAHLGQVERAEDRGAVLVLGEVVVQLAAVDLNLAGALVEPDPGDRGLAPAGAGVRRPGGGCFRHALSPSHDSC